MYNRVEIAREFANAINSDKIIKIILFGSVARGEQQEGSDIDVCFEGNAIGLFKLSALKSELEELFGTTVDLLRMRKQLDGTILKDSVMKDLIYVWTGKETNTRIIGDCHYATIKEDLPYLLDVLMQIKQEEFWILITFLRFNTTMAAHSFVRIYSHCR